MSDADPHDQPTAAEEPRGLPFPVVGVGASAGGLEALTKLLENLPPNPGIAILIVMHLDRNSRSGLPDILARITQMPVHEAIDGIKLEMNHVYIGPGSASLLVGDGVLTLAPRPPRGLYMPIDHLFRSLAAVQKSRSIGVLLSGEGTDGSLGFQAIKAEGGITFAQDEQSARHDSMPRSAVVDGSVDYVLPPDQIARELLRIARHAYSRRRRQRKSASVEAIEQIIALVRIARGRRLHPLQADDDPAADPAADGPAQPREARRNTWQFLRADAVEVQGLYQDFLIRVTQFFRDPEAFEALKEQGLPGAAGESAGRLADPALGGRLLHRRGGLLAGDLPAGIPRATAPTSCPIKILATDLNEHALDKARAGLYLDNIEIDVSRRAAAPVLHPHRRALPDQQGGPRAVRLLAAQHGQRPAVLPPRPGQLPQRADLHGRGAAAAACLPILHYALNPAGFLFLGMSENIGPFSDLFALVDSRHRIFTKKPLDQRALPIDFSLGYAGEGEERRPGRLEGRATIWSAGGRAARGRPHRAGRYAPVGVVIDETMTVLQFRGRTADYLEPAPGMASLDLMRMLRPGLLAEVRAALNRARAENTTVCKEGLRMTEGETTRQIQVEVIPFKVPPSGIRFFLVLFQDVPAAEARRAARPPGAAGSARRPAGRAVAAGTRRPSRIPAVRHRGAGKHQRGIEVCQRGNSLHQRGAAEHQ